MLNWLNIKDNFLKFGRRFIIFFSKFDQVMLVALLLLLASLAVEPTISGKSPAFFHVVFICRHLDVCCSVVADDDDDDDDDG
jgi:hypothetical protein